MNTLPGTSYPLGATISPNGVNFSVFSRNAVALELLLFDQVGDPKPAHTFSLDPNHNRTFYYWHVFIEGLQAGQLYAYHAHGPCDPGRGLRFDGSKVLLDPYAQVIAYDQHYERGAAAHAGNNCAHAMKSVVADPRAYNWEGDIPLQYPFADTVIYEMHVAGFTRHPSSGLMEPPAPGTESAVGLTARPTRGTYAGVIEKIPYLKALGITAVELLPVQQFDEQEAPRG